MLFPWVGLLEQLRLSDVFVHFDDVQFSKGSFVNRVQIKTPQGMRWMTVPLAPWRLGQPIDELRPLESQAWKVQHLALLERSFAGAPYAADALALVERVYAVDHAHLGALARASMLALSRYFGLDTEKRYVDSRDLGIAGRNSERVLAIVKHCGGDTYITGHGAANYLDHLAFERHGVAVEYMHYQCRPYAQSHGPFTPYLSALDLVAHCGRDGRGLISSGTSSWKELALPHQPGL